MIAHPWRRANLLRRIRREGKSMLRATAHTAACSERTT
jgi:hypothetical protein